MEQVQPFFFFYETCVKLDAIISFQYEPYQTESV